jgi:phospholipid/cholesterol/gamma-HCH transport system substrate-binding protein
MTQRYSTARKESLLRILILSSFVLLTTAAVVLIGKDTGIFAPKYKLRVHFGSDNGLRLRYGDKVQLEGVKIGYVLSAFPAQADSSEGAVAVLNLEKQFQGLIRADSTASIAGRGLIGDYVVNVSRGSINQPPVPEHGTIRGVD